MSPIDIFDTDGEVMPRPTIVESEAREKSIREKDQLVVYKTLENVREFGENYPVVLGFYNGIRVVVAANEGGYNCTMVDLAQLLSGILKP